MLVVVGVDDSPHAADVVRVALEEAQRRNAEVHAVHVFNAPFTYLDVPVDMGAVAEAERRAVWEPLAQLLTASEVPSKRIDLEGYPPDRLVSYAEDVDGRDQGARGAGVAGAGQYEPPHHPSGALRCAGGQAPAGGLTGERSLATSGGVRMPASWLWFRRRIISSFGSAFLVRDRAESPEL